jgi:hypothetical protein
MTKLLASILGAAIAVLAGCTDMSFGPPYPGRITTPEVIGVVASNKSDNDGTAHVVLTSGEELVIRPGDRSLYGFGDLMLVGTEPERWYLGATFSADRGCYWFSSSRAFSEPTSVVLAFEDWWGVGLRLPKAPGFDDSKLVYKGSDGRLEYSRLATVQFCSDAEGRLSSGR